MYSEQTHNIRVSVTPDYMPGQSDPASGHYVWSYNIRIENLGVEAVQLLNRYWRITDELGRVQEVRGQGVVGETPVLEPGESFDYSSFTPLDTPSGIMAGHYEMQSETGELLIVAIPAFSLDCPHARRSVN